jgi:hypothetical protein
LKKLKITPMKPIFKSSKIKVFVVKLMLKN